MIKKIACFLCFFLSITYYGYSQITQEIDVSANYNEVIAKHYSFEDLKSIAQSDSTKFKTIIYYYTQSFIITPIACTNCVEFDIKKFDVSWVEKYRKQSERYEHDFEKYGVRVTLLSIDELEYKLPIHLP